MPTIWAANNSVENLYSTQRGKLLMFEYKCEIFYGSAKLVSTMLKEHELVKVNNLINERAAEGWELVTHTFMGNVGAPNGLLLTFKKQTNDLIAGERLE